MGSRRRSRHRQPHTEQRTVLHRPRGKQRGKGGGGGGGRGRVCGFNLCSSFLSQSCQRTGARRQLYAHVESSVVIYLRSLYYEETVMYVKKRCVCVCGWVRVRVYRRVS